MPVPPSSLVRAPGRPSAVSAPGPPRSVAARPLEHVVAVAAVELPAARRAITSAPGPPSASRARSVDQHVGAVVAVAQPEHDRDRARVPDRAGRVGARRAAARAGDQRRAPVSWTVSTPPEALTLTVFSSPGAAVKVSVRVTIVRSGTPLPPG